MSYSIAQAAERTGLTQDTLRYYERIGLADPPQRDSAGRRSYRDDDITWLVFLTKLRTTGMPIRLMLRYARLRELGPASATPRKQILIEHRDEVRARITALRECLDVLDWKIDNYAQMECPHITPADDVPVSA